MKPASNKSDHELTEALSQGDQTALAELFKRYKRQSHYLVKAKVYSDEVAKEIVQDVFADIWEHRHDRPIRHFAAYLFRALKFKTIKHINHLINEKKYWDYYSASIPAFPNQAQHDIDYAFLSEALEEGLNTLPMKTQTVFRLNRLEGKSLSEISKTLNLTEKAIQYHLTKSIKELKVYLKDYFISILIFVFL